MKILKVRIRRGGAGENQLEYPTVYDAEQVDREGSGPTQLFGTSAYSGGVGRGEDHEFCLIALEDELAATYAVDKDIEIIDPSEADVLMEQWRIDNNESEEIIDDLPRIQAITAKQGAGMALSAEDLKAIDVSDSSVAGVRKRLRPYAAVFAKKLPGKVLKDKTDKVIEVAP